MAITKSRKIDPELQTELAKEGSDCVQALITVRPKGLKFGKGAIPQQTTSLVEALIKRVEGQVGVSPNAVNIFRNIGSMAIAAPRAFLRELVHQPEVVKATSNRPKGEMMIKPRRRRAVGVAEVTA